MSVHSFYYTYIIQYNKRLCNTIVNTYEIDKLYSTVIKTMFLMSVHSNYYTCSKIKNYTALYIVNKKQCS